jgi:hypothetical protein
LLVEIRNTIPDAASWVSYAAARAARVRYYKTPTDTCATVVLDRFRDAGAAVGLKLGAVTACNPTPAEIQAKGVSFVTNHASRTTPSYVSDLRSRGVAVYASGATAANARGLLAAGVVRLIVERPRMAAAW